MPGGGVPKSAGDFYESDDPSETTNFILQAASNAGEDWTIETKVLGADLHGGYAQGGLIAYADDDNYVKIDLISPGSRTRPYRIEVRSETGGLARAPRPQVEPLPEGTEDAWLRLTKRGDVYVPAYSLDGENWTTFSQWVGNPIEDPDFGIFAVGVDEPGTEVGFEYFAFDGEVNCGPDTLAPRTSAALDPELPGPGRTYDGPVQVTLEAADASPTETPAAGVAHTEYRVTTNNEIGDWVRVDNVDDADPFVTTLSLDKPGNHVVEFRSADGEGNVEAMRSVSFRIAGVAPCLSDEFDASALHPKWSFVHPTSEEPELAGGSLVYRLGSGDLEGPGRVLRPADPGRRLRGRREVHGRPDGRRLHRGHGRPRRRAGRPDALPGRQQPHADRAGPGGRPGRRVPRADLLRGRDGAQRLHDTEREA